jgi:DNA-binding CsgD family transcriptional regulator
MRDHPKIFRAYAGPKFIADGIEWPDGHVTLRDGNGNERGYLSIHVALNIGVGPGASLEWISTDPRNLPFVDTSGFAELTSTEQRALLCTAQGLNRDEAGTQMGISRETVSNLLIKISKNLGTGSAAHSSVVGVLGGLIDLRTPLDSPHREG